MDKKFFEDELQKFAIVLTKRKITGDEWRRYMDIKINILKQIAIYQDNPRVARYMMNSVTPLVRVRKGKVVWHGVESGDFLAKTKIFDAGYLANPKKYGFQLQKVSGLQKIRTFDAYFPSVCADNFSPSVPAVFRQICAYPDISGTLFEVRLKSENFSDSYDEILKCHVASVIMYRITPYPRQLQDQERLLYEQEESEEDEEDTEEKDKHREPAQIIRLPQRATS